jgi:hypothetical protein
MKLCRATWSDISIVVVRCRATWRDISIVVIQCRATWSEISIVVVRCRATWSDISIVVVRCRATWSDMRRHQLEKFLSLSYDVTVMCKYPLTQTKVLPDALRSKKCPRWNGLERPGFELATASSWRWPRLVSKSGIWNCFSICSGGHLTVKKLADWLGHRKEWSHKSTHLKVTVRVTRLGEFSPNVAQWAIV